MGYKVEFNWALKLKPNQGLDEVNLKVGKRYKFEKEEERIYPINMPLELINENWEVIGKAKVIEVTRSRGKTRGVYEVVAIFDEEKRNIFTENVLRNRRIWTNRND